MCVRVCQRVGVSRTRTYTCTIISTRISKLKKRTLSGLGQQPSCAPITPHQQIHLSRNGYRLLSVETSGLIEAPMSIPRLSDRLRAQSSRTKLASFSSATAMILVELVEKCIISQLGRWLSKQSAPSCLATYLCDIAYMRARRAAKIASDEQTCLSVDTVGVSWLQ